MSLGSKERIYEQFQYREVKIVPLLNKPQTRRWSVKLITCTDVIDMILFAKSLEMSAVRPDVCLAGWLLARCKIEATVVRYLYGTDITSGNEVRIKNSQPSASAAI